MKKPGILLGALVGGLLTLPLLAVMYVGNQIAGFPFVPFSVFVNVEKITPGGVITKVIETMVSVIKALNLGRTDTAAKTIEEALAVLLMLTITIVAGAIFFAVMRRVEQRQEWIPGVILGLVVGIPLTILSIIGDQVYSADKLTSAIWVIGLFLLWGYANNWAYNRLTYGKSIVMVDTSASGVSVQQVDRRQFLITLGGATAAITVVGALVGSMASGENGVTTVATGGGETATEPPDLPNSSASVQPAPGTRPELTPVEDHYRIDIALTPPVIELATWTLPFVVRGSDDSLTKLAEFTMDDLRGKFTPLKQYITQGCISNRIAGDLISTVEWTGAPMQDVLAQVKLPDDATHLLISSADGFYETVALETIKDDPTIMLAYDWAGEPLATEHGFPLRIHISDRYGMKQPKWITQIEVMNHDVDGYWVVRSWDKEALVQSTSVIDTVATQNEFTQNDQKLIPVGGIAWAGARSISKVEVQVDDGAWTEAQLREPLSHKTWVIWRYNWPFVEGSHTFSVRCTDGEGAAQSIYDAPEHPSGATGIHHVTVNV